MCQLGNRMSSSFLSVANFEIFLGFHLTAAIAYLCCSYIALEIFFTWFHACIFGSLWSNMHRMFPRYHHLCYIKIEVMCGWPLKREVCDWLVLVQIFQLLTFSLQLTFKIQQAQLFSKVVMLFSCSTVNFSYYTK